MAGCGPEVGTIQEHIAKLDARFHTMLQANNCNEKTMARFGELSIVSVANLTTLVDDRAALRVFLKGALKLDDASGYDHTLEAGRIVMAWEQACKRSEVENKRDAERLSQNLPPQLTGEDVILLKAQFEKNFNKGRKITTDQTPSQTYLELKVGHAETRWQAESLTEVTNSAQHERYRKANSQEKTFGMDEVGRGFKLLTKPFGIAMPDGSEAIRARLKLMGRCFMFLRLKFPQKGVLQTCTMSVWDQYIEYLFGNSVWNFTIKGENGQPVACPHQGIVLTYDFAMREFAMELMAGGTDMETALDTAMDDVNLKQTSFLANFTTEGGSSRCRALSAPSFKEVHGTGGSQSSKRPLPAIADVADGTSGAPASKRAAKRAKAAEKRKNATPPPQAHPQPRGGRNGGGGGRNGGGGGGGRNGGGGGRNGGKTQLALGDAPPKGAAFKMKTTDLCPQGAGKMICFSYNNGQPCKQTPCLMAHVCQICEQPDHGKSTCPNK